MKISKAQRWKILELWGRVCQQRGWKVSDRALRLTTIGGILGRPLATLDDIGRLDECTKVMAELGCLLGEELRAGREAVDPGLNRQRNARWLIVNDVLPCLALYPLDAPLGRAGAEAYLLEVLRDKSRWLKSDQPTREPRLEDFDDRTTRQILWTLTARLNDKRREAGHTGHEMRLAAGVRCDCARICRKHQLLPTLAPATVAEAEEAGVELPF